MNPPRTLALMSLAALLAVSIWRPALSQGPADLAKVPTDVGLDWFYLPLYPLTNLWGNGAVWAFLGAFSLMIALMPWLPPLRRAKAAAGRSRTLQWLRALCRGLPLRSDPDGPPHDGMPFPTEARSTRRCACLAASVSALVRRRRRSGVPRTQDRNRSAGIFAERIARAGRRCRRDADETGPRAGARLRTRRGRRRLEGTVVCPVSR